MGEYDPAGYIYEGDVYCDACIGDDLKNADEVGAVLESSYWDSPLHCGGCRQFLPTALTEEGYCELEEQIRAFSFEYWGEDLLSEYLSHWDFHDWHVIPTFIGMMDPFGEIRR
jgi:hypothetical protein